MLVSFLGVIFFKIFFLFIYFDLNDYIGESRCIKEALKKERCTLHARCHMTSVWHKEIKYEVKWVANAVNYFTQRKLNLPIPKIAYPSKSSCSASQKYGHHNGWKKSVQRPFGTKINHTSAQPQRLKDDKFSKALWHQNRPHLGATTELCWNRS